MNLVQFPGLGLSFEIDRVAFTIGGVSIYWYGVCIAVGLCLALVFAFRHSIEFGVDPDGMVDVILIGVVLGIASARAYYVAMAPFKYQSIWEMIAIRDGGLAIYGGIIGGFLFDRHGLSRRAVLRPLGQLLQSGGLWLQHHPALGHVQRGHPLLPDGQHGHRAERCDHRPQPAGAPHLPV